MAASGRTTRSGGSAVTVRRIRGADHHGLTPFYVNLETRFPVALCRLGTMRAEVSEKLEHDARWFGIGPISDRIQGRGEQGDNQSPSQFSHAYLRLTMTSHRGV